MHECRRAFNVVHELAEKLWKSEKYQKKAREAMKKLPKSLKSIVAMNSGPTGR